MEIWFDSSTHAGHIATQKSVDGAAIIFHTKTHSSKALTAGERMRIHGNGRVGIGTAAPAELLHVEGKVRAKNGFCIDTDCITSWPTSRRLEEHDTIKNLQSQIDELKEALRVLQQPWYSRLLS